MEEGLWREYASRRNRLMELASERARKSGRPIYPLTSEVIASGSDKGGERARSDLREE